MKVKQFYEPVFSVDVLFMTGTTPEEIKAYLKKRKYQQDIEDDFFNATAGSVTVLENTDKKGIKTTAYLVVVEDKKGFYTLIHETHHLATKIMENIGIPINPHNDEVAAYIQCYWFRTLWRFMNNKIVVLKRAKRP